MPLDDQIALSLYDRLQQVVTGADPGAGLPSAFDNDTTQLIMAQRGMVLNGADYRNPWSPGNTSGNQEATALVASLVDDVPGNEATWSPTQRKVSQVYSELVNLVHVTEPPPSPEIQAARDRANAVLKEQGTDDEGRQTMRNTALADAEAKAFAAYQDAYTTYVATWAAAMADENLRRVWPMTGPTAVAKVRRAWSDWGAAGRDQVKAAKAELATLNEGQVSRVFEEAQWLLNAYQFTVETELQPVLRSRIQPSDWASSDSSSWRRTAFPRATSRPSTAPRRRAGAPRRASASACGASAAGSTTRRRRSTSARRPRTSGSASSGACAPSSGRGWTRPSSTSPAGTSAR